MFWDSDASVAFVGDLVFQGSIGRTDLPLCNTAHMKSSLKLLAETVVPDTRLFPGHMGQTTMAEELRTNPFLSSGQF